MPATPPSNPASLSRPPSNPTSANALLGNSPPEPQIAATSSWTQPPSQESDPEEWLSTSLRPLPLIAYAAITAGFIAALIVLVILSIRYDGFVAVNAASTTILNLDVGLPLVWTTLPTFIFTLYAYWFASIVNACADRQPYVELYTNPSSAAANAAGGRLKQTLLLNYRGYLPGKTVFMATKRRHPLLVFGFTLGIFVAFALTPFAAHLFAVKSTSHSDPITIFPSTEFNLGGITTFTNIVSGFDDTQAALASGGEPPSWTTLDYSFQRFNRPSGAIGNVTANIQATSATLNCVAIDSNVLYTRDGSVQFAFNDRGCIISDSIVLAPKSVNHLTTYAQASLNYTCGGGAAGDSRIAVISFQQEGHLALTNTHVVSCEPFYHNHTGTLQVDYSITTDGQPRVIGFDSIQTYDYSPPRPAFATIFERQLIQAQIFDVSDTDTLSYFGRVIAAYGQHIQGSNPLTSDTVLNATAQVFTTMYAFSTEQYAWKASTAAGSTQGNLLFESQRLFAYNPLVYTSIAILALVLVFLVCTHLYIRTHRSGLFEDPRTIMGPFNLLRDNGFVQAVKDRGHSDVDNGKVWEGIANPEGKSSGWKFWEKRSGTGRYWGLRTRLSTGSEAMQQGWMMANADDAKTAQVVQTPSARRPTWKESFRPNHS